MTRRLGIVHHQRCFVDRFRWQCGRVSDKAAGPPIDWRPMSEHAHGCSFVGAGSTWARECAIIAACRNQHLCLTSQSSPPSRTPTSPPPSFSPYFPPSLTTARSCRSASPASAPPLLFLRIFHCALLDPSDHRIASRQPRLVRRQAPSLKGSSRQHHHRYHHCHSCHRPPLLHRRRRSDRSLLPLTDAVAAL